jgi:hypothetical protein
MKLTQPSAKKKLKLLRPLPPRKSQSNPDHHQDDYHSNVVPHSRQGDIIISKIVETKECNRYVLSCSDSEHQSTEWLQHHAPSHTRPSENDKNNYDTPSRINRHVLESSQAQIHVAVSIPNEYVKDQLLVPKPHIILGGRQQQWHSDTDELPGLALSVMDDARDHDGLDGSLVKCSSYNSLVRSSIKHENAVHVPRRLRSSPTSPSAGTSRERKSKLKPLPPRVTPSVLLNGEGTSDNSSSRGASAYQAGLLHWSNLWPCLLACFVSV